MDKQELFWSESELKGLKTNILRRVQFAWFIKKVLMPAGFVLVASGAILFYAIKAQHVAVILENISEKVAALDIIGLARYFLIAVGKTELDLLAMSVSASLLALYFGRKLIRESVNLFIKGSPQAAQIR